MRQICPAAALHVDRLETIAVDKRAQIYLLQRARERYLLDPAALEDPEDNATVECL